MDVRDRSKEIEKELARFEEENAELVKTLKLLGMSIEEYNEIVQNVWASDIITSNTTGD